MQSSPTRLKKPLHIWLARIIGVGIVLISIGTNLAMLSDAWQNMQHEGYIRDLYGNPQPDGTGIVIFVSSGATEKGVALGDRILNPEAGSVGEIGTPITLRIQRENLPVQEVTFLRKPSDETVWGGMLLGLPQQTSTILALLFNLVPFLVGAIAALLLCWLKSDDWMALLTAIVLTNLAQFPSTNPTVEVFRQFLLSPAVLAWLILFPSGKLAPRWSWVPILLTLPADWIDALYRFHVISYNTFYSGIAPLAGILASASGLVIVGVIVYRYRRIFSPNDRQQTKWVILPFVLALVPSILLSMISTNYWNSGQFETKEMVDFVNSALTVVGSIMLVLGILFSIFRYRLYDVDTFVSRAIVYSSLTGILVLVGSLVVPLINYMLEQSVGDQSNLLGVLVGALPIAALFKPVRDGLQQAVDSRFKPEEMDFENTFIEFTAELRSMFTASELSTLLARHAVDQLDIAQASVFLHSQDGQLKHITTICADQGMSDPHLDEKTIEKLKKGQITSPDGDYEQSLVVPLVVPRSRKPSLLGVLFLGPRLQGVGYSTPMVKSLKKFGEQVGKAFYVAEMKGKQKQTLMENE